MGLFKKRGKPQRFTFFLHIHTVSPVKHSGPVCVTFERGQHTGSTKPVAPSRFSAVFEQQLTLPATLYQDAAAARKGRANGLGPFEPKELCLAVVPADSRGRPAAGQAPLGSITLNLADYAAADGRTQRAFTLAGSSGGSPGSAPKLLVTIACRDASQGSAPAVDVSLSSGDELAAAHFGEGEQLPTSLSSDEEGSRPSSRATSRPDSRAEAAALPSQQAPRGAAALGSVPEDAAPARQAVAVAAVAAAAAEPSGVYDEDGFLIDDSLDVEQSEAPTGSVRRNLGSALERAEPSEAGSRTAQAASSVLGPVEEAESQASAAAAVAAASLPAWRSRQGLDPLSAAAGAGPTPATAAAAAAAAQAVPGTPEEVQHSGWESSAETGQPSSVLSAGADPAVPFSVPPSTQRRFAPREDAGATGRRWAWRREGAAAGAGVTAFQRARLASAATQESPGGGLAAGGMSDGPALSAASSASAAAGARGELPSPRAPSADAAASHGAQAAAAQQQQQQQQQGAAGGLPEAPSLNSAFVAAMAALGQPLGQGQGSQLFRSSAEVAAAGRPHGIGGSANLSLRPNLALLDSSAVLPSPTKLASLAGSSSGGAGLLMLFMQDMRNAAALESAVYLASGRSAFSASASTAGGNTASRSSQRRRLHTPARRLARTIISLGSPEGLAWGEQALHAIQATAGADSGDLHRLTFWWSNVLQLRWMFWALCQGQGLPLEPRHTAAPTAANGSGAGSGPWPAAAASGASVEGGERPLFPRAAAAAAAAARSAAAHGSDWMQLLLPQLRDLEAWLFGEMLKHLWWRVLLQDMTTCQPGSSAPGSPAGAAGTAAAAAAGVSSGAARHSKLVPPLPVGLLRGSSDALSAASTLQGTPRSFETPEEEAVHHWVRALAAVEAALKDRHRPAPAPRAHLALLHRQLITALLHRLDMVLFRRLLLDEGEAPVLRLPSMSSRDAFSRGAEVDEVLGGAAEAAVAALLDPAALPFSRGPVTFSTGVSIKMAVSQLASWAADCGVKEDKLPQVARSTETNDYRLFPCLRATADLLMMPKEVLTDRQMRREVVPGLPLHRICQLLERFEPDDCAPDPLPPGLLEALQSESPASDGGGSTPSPTSRPEEEYRPPPEAALLEEGVIEPMSLEMDEASDEELEGLAAGAGPTPHLPRSSSAGGPAASGPAGAQPAEELRAQRFLLLRDLWTAG